MVKRIQIGQHLMFSLLIMRKIMDSKISLLNQLMIDSHRYKTKKILPLNNITSLTNWDMTLLKKINSIQERKLVDNGVLLIKIQQKMPISSAKILKTHLRHKWTNVLQSTH